MADWVAVTDLILPSFLKKHGLLFDAFTSPVLQAFTSTVTGDNEQSRAEISWLRERGIILDFSHDQDLNFESIFRSRLNLFPEGTDANRFFDEIVELAQKIKTGETTFEQILCSPDMAKRNLRSPYEAASELINHLPSDNLRVFFRGMFTLVGETLPDTVRLMAVVLRDSQKLNAYPLLQDSLLKIFRRELEKQTHEKDVISVILKRLPEPDDSVPWEQIIDYRADPDSKGKLLALRNWIHEIARSELTQQEIEDKLDWLVYDYQRHCELHKMKYNVGTLETIVTVGAQFLEDMVKFKWGEGAKALFSLKHSRVSLLEAEIGNPGSEVAYLVETQKAFS
jgi:hypothetical protein